MILEVNKAAFAYEQGPLLYDNIHFKVSSGEILSILGPNGSGKTTLLKCVMNLLRFNKGEVKIDNKGSDTLSFKEFWKIFSYVPQSGQVRSSLNAIDMVLLGLSPQLGWLKEPKQEEVNLALSILEELEVLYLKDKRCSEMSGGELQMILMARAMISEPKILVLDEPESNLDFKNQMTILSKIKTLAKSRDMIAIINTHYPDHAYKISDKVLMINKKEKGALFGTPEEIITETNLQKIFDIKVAVRDIKVEQEAVKVVVPIM